MAKQAIYYEKARRMIVEDGLTPEIVEDLFGKKVAARTIRDWALKANWKDARAKYLKQTEDLQHELYDLARLAITRAKADPSPQNMFAMAKAISALKSYQGVKVIEDELSPKERKVLTGKTLEEIEKEHKII